MKLISSCIVPASLLIGNVFVAACPPQYMGECPPMDCPPCDDIFNSCVFPNPYDVISQARVYGTVSGVASLGSATLSGNTNVVGSISFGGEVPMVGGNATGTATLTGTTDIVNLNPATVTGNITSLGPNVEITAPLTSVDSTTFETNGGITVMAPIPLTGSGLSPANASFSVTGIGEVPAGGVINIPAGAVFTLPAGFVLVPNAATGGGTATAAASTSAGFTTPGTTRVTVPGGSIAGATGVVINGQVNAISTLPATIPDGAAATILGSAISGITDGIGTFVTQETTPITSGTATVTGTVTVLGVPVTLSGDATISNPLISNGTTAVSTFGLASGASFSGGLFRGETCLTGPVTSGTIQLPISMPSGSGFGSQSPMC